MKRHIAVVTLLFVFASCGALSPPTKLASCGKLTFGADGTVAPVLCPDGRPDAKADAHYRALHLRVFSLGRKVTSASVNEAICEDFRVGHTTIPIESDSVELVEKEEGWHLARDPAQHMDRTAEACFHTPAP